MTKQLKQEWLNCQTIAYYSGFAGIEIKKIGYEYGETYVIFVAGAWSSQKSIHRSKVHYTIPGHSYFIYKGIRIPLSECVRCDIP